MAHPHNRARAERAAGYDYGPPTTQGDGPDDSGVPQDNSDAVVEDADGGESPLSPPPNTDTVTEPGGSPSDEWLALNDPTITSLAPSTGASGAPVAVTVTGTNFDPDSTVEMNQASVPTTYVSATSLTTSLNRATAGTVAVTVRNPTGEQESNSVTFTFT